MALTHRHVASGFEAVAERFEAGVREGDEAQLAIRVGGELVVDLAVGLDPDALMTVYSSSKGVAAFVLALLVDRGELELDERVATYWPEFAAAGKQDVTVRQLLSHQAGLPETDAGIPADAYTDDHRAAELLAAQRPFWRPGAAFGYHAATIGSLMSELCFRVTGEPLQAVYEREVRQPADADAYLGLPEDLEDRVVELLPMPDPTPAEAEAFRAALEAPRGPYGAHVFSLAVAEVFTSRNARRFGHPAGGGVASARGLAAVYAWATGAGADGGAVSGETLGAFAQAQVAGYDLVLDQPHRSHGIVFQKPTPVMPFGSHRAFGHDGAGGAMAFADPVGGISLGYTIRRTPFPGGMDRRLVGVVEELRRVTAERSAR